MDDFVEKFFYGWPKFEESTEIAWIPRVDINEKENKILIDVELPGIEKKDVKIDVKNNILTISGERKQERKIEEKGFSKVERHYGKFERSFGMPNTIDQEKIEANYKDGVLTMTLTKVESKAPKEKLIEIN